MTQPETPAPKIAIENEDTMLAARIQPLPSSVTPSLKFLRRTRQRLSRLSSQKGTDSRRAA